MNSHQRRIERRRRFREFGPYDFRLYAEAYRHAGRRVMAILQEEFKVSQFAECDFHFNPDEAAKFEAMSFTDPQLVPYTQRTGLYYESFFNTEKVKL